MALDPKREKANWQIELQNEEEKRREIVNKLDQTDKRIKQIKNSMTQAAKQEAEHKKVGEEVLARIRERREANPNIKKK